jgi:hypothetical protein
METSIKHRFANVYNSSLDIIVAAEEEEEDENELSLFGLLFFVTAASADEDDERIDISLMDQVDLGIFVAVVAVDEWRWTNNDDDETCRRCIFTKAVIIFIVVGNVDCLFVCEYFLVY